MKRTKIIATVGPSTESYAKLKRLVELGVNVFRLNFSHGTREEQIRKIDLIRKVEKDLKTPIAILQDLQGPRIRVGVIGGGSLDLKTGSLVTLTIKKPMEGEIPVQYKGIVKDVRIKSRILLDDGSLELEVVSKREDKIIAKIKTGGVLKSNKGINLPDVNLEIPALSQKDKEDVKVALKKGIDYIALSFVKTPKDIKDLRRLVSSQGKEAKIISKIERHEAIKNLREIVKESDGIMVARGDLGIELSLEKVPLLQKEIIDLCIFFGKPVIIATQILDSMIRNPRATRAEVSDIANAIIDGADALMLSGETAAGRYPLRAVRTMNKTAIRTENWAFERDMLGALSPKGILSATDAIGKSACKLADDLNARVILNATATGKTTRSLAKFRPKAVIITLTHTADIARELELVWGVSAFKAPFKSIREMVKQGTFFAKKMGLLKTGETIIVISGEKVGLVGGTNIVKVVKAK